jgi:hypothetical protein
MSEHPFDGKSLFIVNIEQSIMVLAKDRKDAESVAQDVVSELDWSESYFAAYQGFLAGWEGSIPFGEQQGDQTCSQIREALAEYERTSARTRAEIEALGQQSLIPENTEAA